MSVAGAHRMESLREVGRWIGGGSGGRGAFAFGERLTSALATTERPPTAGRRPKPKGRTRPEAGPAEVQALSREGAPWLDEWQVEGMLGATGGR
jgi:hypothetical protein